MTVIAGIGFTAPWLLAALAALPVLWLILRAVPPAPRWVIFPGVTLLLGLRDEDTETAVTPWWLLLLRMLAVAALIVGLAGPVLNPQREVGNNRPVLVVVDGSWAGAPDWAARTAFLESRLRKAAQAARPVALLQLTSPEPLHFMDAEDLRARLPGLVPQPWQPGSEAVLRALDIIDGIEGGFETLWLSDGLDFEGRKALIERLRQRGALHVAETDRTVFGLARVGFRDGAVELAVHRNHAGPEHDITVTAHGRDPNGASRVLARADARFPAGERRTEVTFSLPAELHARVDWFGIQGQSSAGAMSLVDDRLARREIALVPGRKGREGLELLSPLHYLRQALVPHADLLEGQLIDMLPANPDVVVLADIAKPAPAETRALTAWVEKGGILLRFAGPRLAASDVSRQEEDILMPVRLREGGRTVGGAMSWGTPKRLQPFPEDSPFHKLPIPDDVTVNSQVLAQPDPALASRVIAQLADGTPLVTRKRLGHGTVILFHVTANAEWSTLPLSGLFVRMLQRLAVLSGATEPAPQELQGTTWRVTQVLDGYGTLRDATTLPGVDGRTLMEGEIGPELRPGHYTSGDRRLARNVLGFDTNLAQATWPSDIMVTNLNGSRERKLGGYLLSLAVVLLAIDAFAALALSGRLGMALRPTALLLAVLLAAPEQSRAQTVIPQAGARDFAAAYNLVLGHVVTGNQQVDATAAAGLRGLSQTLYFRTAVEPGDPIAVDLEQDELAFFPFLYWPITPEQPSPSDEAYAKLNSYLRFGGMILFDTRDSNVGIYGATTPESVKLRRLAAPLDIPPLEPVPQDHVLSRAFYLLQEFPGRHTDGTIWVEAAPPDSERIEGMPFRNPNDGVTPVVVGGNDWATAWAVDGSGQPSFQVGHGLSGERQRELALRFGVNLVMHVLSGNYKSDQVHVPALLERLGQ